MKEGGMLLYDVESRNIIAQEHAKLLRAQAEESSKFLAPAPIQDDRVLRTAAVFALGVLAEQHHADAHVLGDPNRQSEDGAVLRPFNVANHLESDAV